MQRIIGRFPGQEYSHGVIPDASQKQPHRLNAYVEKYPYVVIRVPFGMFPASSLTSVIVPWTKTGMLEVPQGSGFSVHWVIPGGNNATHVNPVCT